MCLPPGHEIQNKICKVMENANAVTKMSNIIRFVFKKKSNLRKVNVAK